MSNQSELPTFEKVTLQQLAWLLDAFPFTRQIDAIHLHHSGRPNHRQYRGHQTLVEISHQHVAAYGLGTIAQHLTVAPDGTIWLGRNWNLPPASAAGHNGSARSGPLMITMIGDFDWGQDRLAFDGDAPLYAANQPDSQQQEGQQQGNVTLQLIALIQNHFGLDIETLRFHRDMSDVSSPGSTVDHREMLRELRKVRAVLRKAAKEGNGTQMTSDDLQQARLLLNRFSKQGTQLADAATAEVPQQAVGNNDYNRFINGGSEANRGDVNLFGAPKITPAMLDELAPHVINLTMGHFSQEGILQTDETDVDAIFEEHLVRAFADRNRDEPLRVVFYAHGGLVSERVALEQAYQHVPWWRKNNVYPIYFIWETDLWPMFMQSLRGTRDRALAREALTDNFVERLARGLGGPRVWQAIKSNAQIATLDSDGGARYAIGKLQEFLQDRADNVELHAIGHSAGAIFQSYFVPQIIQDNVGQFQTVQFLAPAITVADFKARMMTHMGNGIEQLPIFTMRKELERNDPVASPWYNRSILYLVSHAMEPVRNTPILGLEESLRADVEMKRAFGLRGRAADHGEVIWTTTLQGSGRSASGAVSHVEFNCDPPTMNSALRRLVGADDNDPIEEYPSVYACGARNVSVDTALPSALEELAREGLLDANALFQPTTAAQVDNRPTTNGQTQPLNGGGSFIPIPGGGRRRALCIGIDDYAESPLSGCVADAKLWAETLQRLGFAAPQLLLDSEATRGAIVQAFTEMVAGSRAGDVVVIQFAGHGIFLPDVNGDEINEDSPYDEAICPIDFNSGAYLIDDDIRAIFAQIPDGVNVTCFFDCCHSGTISRFAVGSSLTDDAHGERARYLRATPARIDAHRRYRRDMGFQRQAVSSRGPASMRDVVFSACLSTEVALESNGHGHFTLRATEQLRQGIDGITNEQFHRNVVDAFGPERRQTPYLDCASAASSRPILQPIAQAVPGEMGNGTHMNDGRTNEHLVQDTSTTSPVDKAEVVALLHQLLNALE